MQGLPVRPRLSAATDMLLRRQEVVALQGEVENKFVWHDVGVKFV